MEVQQKVCTQYGQKSHAVSSTIITLQKIERTKREKTWTGVETSSKYNYHVWWDIFIFSRKCVSRMGSHLGGIFSCKSKAVGKTKKSQLCNVYISKNKQKMDTVELPNYMAPYKGVVIRVMTSSRPGNDKRHGVRTGESAQTSNIVYTRVFSLPNARIVIYLKPMSVQCTSIIPTFSLSHGVPCMTIVIPVAAWLTVP